MENGNSCINVAFIPLLIAIMPYMDIKLMDLSCIALAVSNIARYLLVFTGVVYSSDDVGHEGGCAWCKPYCNSGSCDWQQDFMEIQP